MIRAFSAEDVAHVVTVHMKSFPDYFLTFLGRRFLTLYYAGVCSAQEGICFVALDESMTPKGFVVGASNPRGFYSRLLKCDWFKFACASIVPILKKPSIIRRIARGISHPDANPVGNNIAGLFSIGVLPELQGSGAGRALVNAFLIRAKQQGCTDVFLTTDRDGNDAVNAFYHKLGFDIRHRYTTPEGRHMNEYWINLTHKDPEHE